MKTVHKIAFARILYRTISTARRSFGYPDRVITTRRGLGYELDLREGIDLAIYVLGAFEPSTYRVLTKHVKPGMTVLDIGANVGSHTLHLARLVQSTGRVYAFEPTTFAYTKLLRNLSLNQELMPRVIPQQCFLVGDQSDELPRQIYSSWPLTGENNLHPKHLGAQKSTKGALARTLDSILAESGDPPVHVVKLDVDGSECEVLSGATTMLSRHKPTFVMELSPYVLLERGGSLERLMSFFVPLGYRFFHEKTGKELPAEPQHLSRMIGDGASINVVAR
jgi:FkbM family methyltransferase